MNLEISEIELKDNFKAEEPDSRLRYGEVFRNEPLVFERSENSDLVPVALPVTQEFFEKVFAAAGPFWEIYSGIGFAVKPDGLQYAEFIQGRMYFLKNIEHRFMNGLGPERTFEVRKNLLVQRKKIDLPNILLALSCPLDAMKQFARTISLGFVINESVKEFEDFTGRTNAYCGRYENPADINDPVRIAKESLEFAVSAVRYTNLALLSYDLKIKFRRSEAVEVCALEELSKLAGQKKWDAVKEKFGFYSLVPYDASKPRFREDMADMQKYGLPPFPGSSALKWRENAKFLIAKYLSVERLALRKIGEITGLGDAVFFLKVSELEGVDLNDKKQIGFLTANINKRKEQFEKWESVELPPRIIFYGGRKYAARKAAAENRLKDIIQAVSVSAQENVKGIAVNINSFDDYAKCNGNSIIISKTLSPNLAILFRKAVGVISESGSALSHAALVAREMKIPCLVQAVLAEDIKDGQLIEINGKTGMARFIEKNEFVLKELHEKPTNPVLVLGHAAKRNIIKTKISVISRSGKNIIWLGDPGSNGADIGVKAANLSSLYNLCPVPPGFSVTLKVFIEFFRSDALRDLVAKIERSDPDNIAAIEEASSCIRSIIESLNFPAGFEKDLEENFRRLNSGAAVRSSSSIEDLGNASFAGQFDTFLDIKNLAGLKNSIKKCWASFYGTRAVIYRIENNISAENAGMAVLVQQMVKAKYSGVMFTASPEDKNMISLEAVPGQGEELVSGEAIPNSYLIDRTSFSVMDGKKEFDFDKKYLRELARMGMNIEKYFTAPQDIEWCIDLNGKIWILQARPITA